MHYGKGAAVFAITLGPGHPIPVAALMNEATRGVQVVGQNSAKNRRSLTLVLFFQWQAFGKLICQNSKMSLRSTLSKLVRKPSSEQSTTSSIHVTSSCKRYSHPEFLIQVSNTVVPDVDISFLLQFFEQKVAQGGKFRSGESLQVGWMFTMLENGPDGFLRVLEPDMKVVPVKFVDSVDNTLLHLRSQLETVRSLSPAVEPDFPSLRQSVIVHKNYKASSRLLLSRSGAADSADSGWWLSDLDDQKGAQDPACFFKTSLYQLAVDRPDLVKFFALPKGLQVVVDGALIGVLGEDGEVQQIPGSYLNELNKLRQQRASATRQSFDN